MLVMQLEQTVVQSKASIIVIRTATLAQPSTDFARPDMLPFLILTLVLKCAPIYNAVSKNTVIILKKLNFSNSTLN